MDEQAFQQMLLEVDSLESSKGIDMNELLTVSQELSQLLVWMVRQRGFQAEDVASFLSCDQHSAQILLDRLVSKSLVEELKDIQMYHAQVISSRTVRKYRVSDDVWKVFD